jgi:L-alanine-DL-glutamate epimerase-like enolase superfamily enzyme
VCAEECTTRRFLDWLEEPLMAWEIEEDKRLRQRRRDLMRGVIPA